MLKDYLKLSWRHLSRRRGYAVINIFGLGVGLACCTFIGLYLLDELSFDRFHERTDRIVRLAEDQVFDGRVSRLATTYGPLAPALEVDLPAVEHAVRVLPQSLLVHRADGQRFQEDAFYFVDYAETYGLEVVAGRDLTEAFASDATAGFLLNEAAARRMGWTPLEAVGQEVSLGVWFEGHLDKTGNVVGVVRDFQYHSLRRGIDPILFHILPGSYYYDYVSVRVRPGEVAGTLAALESVWGQFNTERPFEYRFLDAQFDALYRAEARLGGLFGTFAGLAVVIACLGLFGLAALTTKRRTREIGVRKVLGATVPGLVALLSKDLLWLVALAFAVAAPLAYVGMQRWLDGFAYRVEVSGWMVLLAGGLALLVAWLAVGYHAVRAALADPVESLRYE